MRVAIIDIGTNTINLLVADTLDGGGYAITHSSKVTARLGRGGINDGVLTPEAIQRGIDAIQSHVDTLNALGHVDRVVAIGTSALRNAKNSNVFVDALKNSFNIDVRIISGDEEAAMIFDGVKQVLPIGRERVLILDIGGGSCEFIIANKDGILWKHSYELGMSRIVDRFPISDPITPQQIKDIENFFRPDLMSLYEALHNYPTSTLVGTSGSFDTMAAIVAARNHPFLNVRLSTSYEIPIANFDEVYHKLISSTVKQRMEMKHLDPARVEQIIPGVIFINFILREMRMQSMYQCAFSLKQGAIFQLLNS